MLQENEESISFYPGGGECHFLVSLFSFSPFRGCQMVDLPDWPNLIEVSHEMTHYELFRKRITLYLGDAQDSALRHLPRVGKLTAVTGRRFLNCSHDCARNVYTSILQRTACSDALSFMTERRLRMLSYRSTSTIHPLLPSADS